MADKKTSASSRLSTRKKVVEVKKEVEVKREVKKELKKEVKKGEKAPTEGEEMEVVADANGAEANGAAANGATAENGNGETPPEVMELPPFEIITGDRMDPFFYKFQFKNVEYSSGRNKTFLCYLVDSGNPCIGLKRGYIEDEHMGAHSEQAFFLEILPDYEPSLKYTVTWYVSSSPCATCAAKLVEILKARKSLKLTIFSARLFEWEDPDIQAGLKALHAAGCKLRMMKPLDFTYTWDTFVEDDLATFTPWEDCQENYEYYQEKLADILQQ